MSDLGNFLLPNEPTCIVACSSATARFWRSDSRFGQWALIHELRDDDATAPESEFASDRPGRAFDIVGAGRHSMTPPESGQRHQALLFARKVAAFLNEAIAASRVSHLVILAAPDFLGNLRTELSDSALRAVALSEPKNLVDLEENDIRSYFE